MRLRYLLAIVVLELGGCGSLDQAPLIYSSQKSFGINVSGTTAANPGASIDIGYKQTDFAYVPVAVALPASSAASGVPLQVIRAEWGQDGSSASQEQLLADRAAKVKEYDKASTDQTSAKDTLSQASNALAALVKRQALLDDARSKLDHQIVSASAGASGASGAALPAPAASGTGDVASNQANALNTLLTPALKALGDEDLQRFIPITSSTDLSVLASLLKGLAAANDASIRDAKGAVKLAQDGVDSTNNAAAAARTRLEQVDRLLGTKRTDAMSVYGTFQADGQTTTSGGGTSGGLTVGNVFSTGLASQNLTEAARASAVAECVSKSLTAFATAASGVGPTERASLIASLSSGCYSQRWQLALAGRVSRRFLVRSAGTVARWRPEGLLE